jgi:hypothetical protein
MDEKNLIVCFRQCFALVDETYLTILGFPPIILTLKISCIRFLKLMLTIVRLVLVILVFPPYFII